MQQYVPKTWELLTHCLLGLYSKVIFFFFILFCIVHITHSGGCSSEVCPTQELIQCHNFNIPHIDFVW